MKQTNLNRKAKWDNDCQKILEFKLPFRLEDANAVIGGDNLNLIRTYTIIKSLERAGKLRKIRANTYETL